MDAVSAAIGLSSLITVLVLIFAFLLVYKGVKIIPQSQVYVI